MNEPKHGEEWSTPEDATAPVTIEEARALLAAWEAMPNGATVPPILAARLCDCAPDFLRLVVEQSDRVDVAERRISRLTRLMLWVAARRDQLTSEFSVVTSDRDRLLAIVEGRAVPPTDAEIAALAADGGKWRVRAQWSRSGNRQTVDTVNSWAPQIAALLREQTDTHWWATDANDVLRAWPVAP